MSDSSDILDGKMAILVVIKQRNDVMKLVGLDLIVQKLLVKQLALQYFGAHHLAYSQHAAPAGVVYIILLENFWQ